MPTDDPLDALRERIRATQEAAEQLAGDAPRIPPQGWAAPGSGAEGAPADRPRRELQQLVALLASLRDLCRRSSSSRSTDLIRQVLVLVRAILDRWIDRLEPGRGGEPDVEDIPIS